MGLQNFLIEGGSGTGKTSVCSELQRRGLHAVHGDRELAYQGDPSTGAPVDGVTGIAMHDHHLWSVEEVRRIAVDRSEAVTFFCGGSRNLAAFVDVFDAVFVLEADLDTVHRRLDGRSADEWGGRATERELIERLHRSRADVPPDAIPIDAALPVADVVDEILGHIAGMA